MKNYAVALLEQELSRVGSALQRYTESLDYWQEEVQRLLCPDKQLKWRFKFCVDHPPQEIARLVEDGWTLTENILEKYTDEADDEMLERQQCAKSHERHVQKLSRIVRLCEYRMKKLNETLVWVKGQQ